MQVFENNEEVVKVNSVLTLAYFSVLTGYSYNRVAKWQRIERTGTNPICYYTPHSEHKRRGKDGTVQTAGSKAEG